MANGNNKYKLLFSKTAIKDKTKLKNSGLENNCRKILDIMIDDPFKYPPSYEKLVGELSGFYSKRINRQQRIVYKINEKKCEIYIYRMWTHYDD